MDTIDRRLSEETSKSNIKCSLAFKGLDYNSGISIETLKERFELYKKYRKASLEKKIKLVYKSNN